MKFLAYFFFYTYTGLMIVAGLWGAFLGPRWDQHYLLGFNIERTDPQVSANILSQYRFLRLVEFGFGWFAVLFTKEIFSLVKFNRLFITIMFLGVMARLLSYLQDGPPGWIFYFFAIYEFAGVVLIYLFTKNKLNHVKPA